MDRIGAGGFRAARVEGWIKMAYLSEDPTLLAGLLLLVAGGFVVALRVTQQGKYLIRALIAAGLAAAVVLVEWLWVTDSERIEQVVYGLRDAVANSDVERVLSYMAPDVQYVKGETSLDGETTRGFIRANLERARFEIVRISGLETSAAEQSRRGTAQFHVLAKGTMDASIATMNIGTADSLWSLGLRETQPGIWKVNRITPMQVPRGALDVPGGSRGSRRAAFAR
jgi:hypothetical protein